MVVVVVGSAPFHQVPLVCEQFYELLVVEPTVSSFVKVCLLILCQHIYQLGVLPV